MPSVSTIDRTNVILCSTEKIIMVSTILKVEHLFSVRDFLMDFIVTEKRVFLNASDS